MADDAFAALARASRAGVPAVMVTVASVTGSAPRAPGARMTVTRDGSFGTVGGGRLEFDAIAFARASLGSGGARAQLRRYALGASLGQCCGGAVELVFETVPPRGQWLNPVLRHDAADLPCVRIVPLAAASDIATEAGEHETRVFGALGADPLDEPVESIVGDALSGAASTSVHDLCLGARRIRCLVDPVRPTDWQIVVFGAGHVGAALVRALSGLACAIRWVDTRDDAFPAELPANVRCVCTDIPEAEVHAAGVATDFVVLTQSHALDQRLAEAILARGDFAYFGLIGSATKRRLFEHRLRARGAAPERLARMTCPIGVAGVSDKSPPAIALATAAQMMQAREVLRARGRVQGDVQGHAQGHERRPGGSVRPAHGDGAREFANREDAWQ